MGEAAVSPRWRGGRGEVSLQAISLGLPLLVGMAGAVTAQGDTVFRPGSLASGIMQELAPAAHPLVRMRLVHPGVAALASLLTAYWASTMSMRPLASVHRGAQLIWTLLVPQLVAGATNVLLLAPLGL